MIRTKIIATIGPASDASEMIAKLLDGGVDVFRLNFSHGTLEQHGRAYQRIRRLAAERGKNVAVMGDLCGPKIRVDPIENDSFTIRRGDQLRIVQGHVVGGPEAISTNRPELLDELREGHRILIDDGRVRLRVQSVTTDTVTATCEIGGPISTRKGLNLPDTDLQMSALTEKDREDLRWAIDNGVDYVAISFVRKADDIEELRALFPLEDTVRIVAKIETPQAIDDIDRIIEIADVVLVARGDLGVEMELSAVPLVQKDITRRCQTRGKPVIIATQMLQSMVDQPTATRAEVSDVANAIFDAADAVMLSAETSIGEYAVESVDMMTQIAMKTEDYLSKQGALARMDLGATLRRATTAVAHSANLLAKETDARAVAVWSDTGNTARLLSKTRLSMPVVGLAADERVCRRMAMYYGVLPVQLDRKRNIPAMLSDVDALLLDRDLVSTGDLIVVIDGTRLEQPGATSGLLLHVVADSNAGA